MPLTFGLVFFALLEWLFRRSQQASYASTRTPFQKAT
jgi:hypothetical protein